MPEPTTTERSDAAALPDAVMAKLAPILSDLFRVDRALLKDEVSMDDLDAWDSLTHMELVVALENTFGIELTGDEIADLQSIGAIRTVLRKRGAS